MFFTVQLSDNVKNNFYNVQIYLTDKLKIVYQINILQCRMSG